MVARELRGWALAALLLAAAAPSGAATGVVFVDADGDGARGPGEAGQGGALVSNGLDVVRSDASGRYTLPDREGFVVLTRPAGFGCERWYGRGDVDFALTREPATESFLFVHVSDAHVYDRIEDFREFSSPPVPGWVPQIAVDWLTLRMLGRSYGRGDAGAVARSLRRALADRYEPAELESLFDVTVYGRYREELARPGSPLGDVAGQVRAAFREIGALGPAFVIHTGDLVLEGNQGSPEAVERWFDFYGEVRALPGVPVYETIGNNEIAGTQNAAFLHTDPRYGKAIFHARLGPSHYSFDRGAFHFVALDTHRSDPLPNHPKNGHINRMPDEVRAWAEADLAAHPEAVRVVLNHEPFHYDPAWPFAEPDPEQTALDEGLFAAHDVRYVLSGHTHHRSYWPEGGITHFTAGALSGLRWVLPADLHARGYRLFYARGGVLHSAWKETGKPVVAWAEGGAGDVIAAADRRGPFVALEASDALGRPIEVEPWGDYFARLVAPGPGAVRVVATGLDGVALAFELEARGAAATADAPGAPD